MNGRAAPRTSYKLPGNVDRKCFKPVSFQVDVHRRPLSVHDWPDVELLLLQYPPILPLPRQRVQTNSPSALLNVVQKAESATTATATYSNVYARHDAQ